LIDIVDAFNIFVIPHSNNVVVDYLAMITSILSPLEDFEASGFVVELIYRPSILDNVTN